MGFPVFGQLFGRRFGRSFGRGGGQNPNAGYTLYDRFSVPVAAGSVNGTLADTGQVRTVTDTNNKLSITGGVLNFTTGGVGAGDPGLWYPVMTRQLGLTLLATFVMTTNALEVGWDSAAAGAILVAIRPTGGGLTVEDNAFIPTVGAGIVSGTTYQIAISLRSTGSYYFIKGGIYTNWTMIWISRLGSGNLLPAATVVSAIDVGTVDNVRVPTTLYIPLALAYDTFTRANGALGSTETTSPDGVTIAALTWLFTVGVWAVNGNKAVATPNLGADAIVNGTFAADVSWTKGAGWTIATGLATAAAASSDLSQTVAPLTVGRWYQVVWTVTGFSLGTAQAVVGGFALPTHGANGTFTEIARAGTTAFLIRAAGYTGSVDNVSAQVLATADLFATVLCSSADVIIDKAITLASATGGIPDGIVVNLDNVANPQNFIIAYLDGLGNCVLEECVAGVFATKFTTAVTYSAGAILRVIRDGTSCRVFYNNAAVNTVQTMTANTNKNHGMFAVSALNSGDNVTILARGVNNEYGSLDQL